MKSEVVLRPFSPGIQVPGEEAKVKVPAGYSERRPNAHGFYCHNGSICAMGSAVPPTGGLSLVRIHARIYRLNETFPGPNDPPSPTLLAALCDPLARVVETHGNLDWTIPEIPNAQCENASPGNSDNRLVVWAVWDQGAPTQQSQTFRGVCSDKTDCESAKKD